MAEKDKANENEDAGDKTQFDPDTMASDISKQVVKEMPDMDRFANDIVHRIEINTKAKNDSDDSDADEEDESDDDTEILTRGEVKALLKKERQEFKTTVDEVLNESSKKVSRDAEALKLFPMLNRESKLHDMGFETKVFKEVDRRIDAGRDPKDTDLVYDAAATVFVSDVKWRRQMDAAVEEGYERDQNKHLNFQSSTRRGTEAKESNKAQNEYAEKWNLTSERRKALRKKYNY